MPLYDFHCSECKGIVEKVQPWEASAPTCCDSPMIKGPGSVAMLRVEGMGYPSRRKWMDNWTPESKPFAVTSRHGEREYN